MTSPSSGCPGRAGLGHDLDAAPEEAARARLAVRLATALGCPSNAARHLAAPAGTARGVRIALARGANAPIEDALELETTILVVPADRLLPDARPEDALAVAGAIRVTVACPRAQHASREHAPLRRPAVAIDLALGLAVGAAAEEAACSRPALLVDGAIADALHARTEDATMVRGAIGIADACRFEPGASPIEAATALAAAVGVAVTFTVALEAALSLAPRP